MSLKDRLAQIRPGSLDRKLLDETEIEHERRTEHLARMAVHNQERHAARWTGPLAPRQGLTLEELEQAAQLLSRHPDLTVLDVLQCLGVQDNGRDILIPLEGRYRNEIESRAKRLRVTEQGLTPQEISEVSINYLVSVIDDEKESTRDRLKAVETLAKIAGVDKDSDGAEHQPESVQVFVQELRSKLLGVGE